MSIPSQYHILQINGQRIYCPKSTSAIKSPPFGTEIFVGRLPKNCYEDRLLTIFRRCGEIYKLRLMMDFSGLTRGYAFITYFKKEDAWKAVKTLNNTHIDTSTIVVTFSVDNRRLFLGGVPKEMSDVDIKASLVNLVDGVEKIIIYIDPMKPELNRGFAFVEFSDHAKAAMARRSLSLGNLILREKKITVDWAEPTPEIDLNILVTLDRLYLSNIPLRYTSNNLVQIIYDIVKTPSIQKVHKESDFAFVHFTTKKTAEDALKKLSGLILDGQKIRVEWARPPSYNKKNRIHQVPENFCRSVPPRMRRIVEGYKAQINQTNPRNFIITETDNAVVKNNATTVTSSNATVANKITTTTSKNSIINSKHATFTNTTITSYAKITSNGIIKNDNTNNASLNVNNYGTVPNNTPTTNINYISPINNTQDNENYFNGQSIMTWSLDRKNDYPINLPDPPTSGRYPLYSLW